MDARLAFYFKESPEEWDDEKWALRWAQLQYVLKNDYAIKNKLIGN
jgi:hypothetical protein